MKTLNPKLKPVFDLTRDDLEAIQNLRRIVIRGLNGSLFNAVEKAYLSPVVRQINLTLTKLENCLQ